MASLLYKGDPTPSLCSNVPTSLLVTFRSLGGRLHKTGTRGAKVAVWLALRVPANNLDGFKTDADYKAGGNSNVGIGVEVGASLGGSSADSKT